MIFLVLVLGPVAGGAAVWIAGDRRRRLGAPVAVVAAVATVASAVLAVADRPELSVRWGAGLSLRLLFDDVAAAPLLLVPLVGSAVVVYALGYGEEHGRARLVGLLLAFMGAMELLLVAGDLVTLIGAWELVGTVSWGLIAHHGDGEAASAANHAFVATRAGDLGLLAAAGAVFSAGGAVTFDALATVGGGWLHLATAGILLAAVAKSAQVPFSPWLFSAMAGPTPASALLHSATMVAAGAYLLARLQPSLDRVAWFAPVTIGIGLVTALGGGVVALLHPRVKHLLAASTSAHYGLMLVAVGAGYPVVAVAHLVAHGAFKALLFVAAGAAIDEAGTDRLSRLRLGRRLPAVAATAVVGAVALAGVPPLGAAWTKEQIVAAAAARSPVLGLLVVTAGGLSAAYATRFLLAAFGWRRPDERHDAGAGSMPGSTSGTVVGPLVALAGGTVVLSALWWPPGRAVLDELTLGPLPPTHRWEVPVSLAAVAVGIYAVTVAARRGGAGAADAGGRDEAAAPVADWFGLPTLSRRAVAGPVLALARCSARFDDRVVDGGIRTVGATARRAARFLAAGDDRIVDAGVRGTARLALLWADVSGRIVEVGLDAGVRSGAGLVGAAGRDARRLQTGQAHHYYLGIALALLGLVGLAVLWR